MNNFRINTVDARKHMHSVEKQIKKKYGIKIINDNSFSKGQGGVANKCDGSLNIYINKRVDFDESSTSNSNRTASKYVNPLDFTNYIRGLYHEEQHIKQSIHKMYSHDDDAIQMGMKNLSCEGNIDYYNKSNRRYNNNLAEIDAERIAIIKTYDFLKDVVKLDNAEDLICTMVNDKTENTDYFIKGQFNKVSDIKSAFDTKYEEAKFSQTNYLIVRLRQSDTINPQNDECIKYLQQIVQMDEQNMDIMQMFWDEKDCFEKDKLVAGIVHHLHPEIDYKRLYPCLAGEDLSNEAVFGRKLPEPTDIYYFDRKREKYTSEPICNQYKDKLLKKRIKKADKLHKVIKDDYDEFDISIGNENLNESLLQDCKHDDKSMEI